MKVLKIALRIVLSVLFVMLAVIAIRFLILGGWTEFKDKIGEVGFFEFIKWFFTSMWSGGSYISTF
ncbi:MAG: hypothetical protein KBT30_02795 [Clostridiales bacterium]|nr:hypothetical protein [Candidatus Apopatousia equi]